MLRPYDGRVEQITFVPNEQDTANLAILHAVGLTQHAAIRVALTKLAADMTPVALALREDEPVAA